MSEPADVTPPPVLRDRDLFHDSDGRVFVAHGFIQPTRRTISFLKYIPTPTGKWQKGTQYYTRLFSGGPGSVIDGMESAPEKYLFKDPYFGVELLEVPHDYISHYYSPELRLQEILHTESLDSLENLVKITAEILHDTLGIPLDRIGVTGSIAWKAHNPSFSDINMNVYGLESCQLLKEGYELTADANPNVRLRQLDEWIAGTITRLRTRVPNLTLDDLKRMYQRRKELCVNEFYIGVMSVPLPDELPIRYGSEKYTDSTNTPIKVELELESVELGSFIPALYDCISPPLDILNGERISRIIVYDGAFKDLFLEGDRIEVCGTLQEVQQVHENTTFYQIMVGTKAGAGKEYLRLLEPQGS